ncbi:MAG TPA: HIT family protein [Candidatus Nanoarchaeia archaeon]|nr:HIT family protein [Candidatus Nanoarchaeia archaeon]
MAEDCIFCKIVSKQAPSSIVYEDECVLVFMDLRPVSEGHALVIPKQHYVDIFDIPAELLAETHKVTKAIAAAVKKATCADGISIVQQNGKAAGQDIFHMHVHVIPRFEGQKMPHFDELTVFEREKLDEMAAKIKKEL